MGDAKKTLQRVGAAESHSERDEMHRQKNRQGDAGQPMQHRRQESRLEVRIADHARYTASAALTPRTSSSPAKASIATSSERSRHFAHSRRIERSPIGAWIAAAITKTR